VGASPTFPYMYVRYTHHPTSYIALHPGRFLSVLANIVPRRSATGYCAPSEYTLAGKPTTKPLASQGGPLVCFARERSASRCYAGLWPSWRRFRSAASR